LTQDCQLFFCLSPLFSPLLANFYRHNRPKRRILPAENPFTSLSVRKSIRALRQKINFFFSHFSDFPVLANLTAQKTIGAYTESISTGPELMQSQTANQ
jgi:hypothetical protein